VEGKNAMRRAALIVLLAVTASAAQAQNATVPDNICSQVTRTSSGAWQVTDITLDVGSCKAIRLQNQLVTPNMIRMCGADLFDVIQNVCGTRR
jgi:hypothetical protein